MTSPGGVPKSVDEYFARVPDDMRPTLEKLRKTIKSVVPEAEEVLSYGIPTLQLHGGIVSYAAFADHCSLFAGREVFQEFAAELKPFASGRSTIRFTPKDPLPASLVTRIVKARVAANMARDSKPKVAKRGGTKSR